MKTGILYIVSTPIGNLRDLTIRAIDILTKVEIIACEDTRRTGLLLKYISSHPEPRHAEFISATHRILKQVQDDKKSVQHDTYETKPILLSYYEQNELQRIPQVINALKNGVDVALVSDAGTPTISDPGFKLVRECVKEGIKVESIPGPSSVMSSLVVSGLPTDKFLFLGYLPKKSGKRKKLFSELFQCFKTFKFFKPTIVFFESPNRLNETLEDVKEIFGNLNIVIARELTKVHEEIRRENLEDAIDHFLEVPPKGEFVILFNPK